MTEPTDQRDLLEFPCVYEFKAVGLAGDGFRESVMEAVARFTSVSVDAVRSRPSGKGNYQAVSVVTSLQSYEQLVAIYAELKKLPQLKMLL